MEISQSQFQTTDFNYGLIEGSQGLLYKQKTEAEPGQKSNIFATSPINTPLPKKKKKSSLRFNICDSEYLDETPYTPAPEQPKEENLFAVQPKPNQLLEASKTIKGVIKNIPVINSVVLKGKSLKLQKTLEGLNEINRSVDDIVNLAVPYGEENKKYDELTKNLTDASNLLGQAKKEIE